MISKLERKLLRMIKKLSSKIDDLTKLKDKGFASTKLLPLNDRTRQAQVA